MQCKKERRGCFETTPNTFNFNCSIHHSSDSLCLPERLGPSNLLGRCDYYCGRNYNDEMKNEDKVILDLCGGTGAWSKPYKDAGYDVIIITLPDDVRLFRLYIAKVNFLGRVYGILAAPPCCHLSGSGARWWKEKGTESLLEALSIADACLRYVALCQPTFWALENPVGRLSHYYGKPKMYFNPCDYGDPYTKKTCLWGEFNIPKKNPVKPEKKNRIHYCPPGPKRAEIRSITPLGFAKAFFESNK